MIVLPWNVTCACYEFSVIRPLKCPGMWQVNLIKRNAKRKKKTVSCTQTLCSFGVLRRNITGAFWHLGCRVQLPIRANDCGRARVNANGFYISIYQHVCMAVLPEHATFVFEERCRSHQHLPGHSGIQPFNCISVWMCFSSRDFVGCKNTYALLICVGEKKWKLQCDACKN